VAVLAAAAAAELTAAAPAAVGAAAAAVAVGAAALSAAAAWAKALAAVAASAAAAAAAAAAASVWAVGDVSLLVLENVDVRIEPSALQPASPPPPSKREGRPETSIHVIQSIVYARFLSWHPTTRLAISGRAGPTKLAREPARAGIRNATPRKVSVTAYRRLRVAVGRGGSPPYVRGLHSSNFRLNVSTFCGMHWVHDFPPVY